MRRRRSSIVSVLPPSCRRPVVAAWAALAAVLVFAGACSQNMSAPPVPPGITAAASGESGPVPDATSADHAAFPEVCGSADDPMVCARVPLELPDGAALGGAVLELAGVERVLGGSEVRIAARTPRGWVELPFVLESAPPCEGEARLGRVVEARVAGATLVLRVQSAVRDEGPEVADDEPARELEENAWLCTFAEPTPACSRVRTARGAARPGAARKALAEARWTTERALRVQPGGRVVLELVSQPARP